MQNPINERPARSLAPSNRRQTEMLEAGEICTRETLRSLLTPDTPLDRCPTNLDLADKKQAAIALSCMGVPDLQLDQTGRIAIKARYFLCYADWLPNEQTGAMEPVIFTVLIDKDGRYFKTSGVYGPRAIRAASELFSERDWQDGITIVVTSRLTSQKRIAHNLQFIIDADDVTGPPA